MIRKIREYANGIYRELVRNESNRLEETRVEEINRYDLTQLSLVLPDWINDFRATPFIRSLMIYPSLTTALKRYEEITGEIYVQVNSQTEEIEWPTQSDLRKLGRLETRMSGLTPAIK